jgi:large subunit ribosomal protein L1
MARGKRFRAAYEQVDRNHNYEPGEAVDLLKRTASAKFDETVELHIRLGVNVRHAEEQLRGTLALPHGTGGDVTVAVFAEGEKAREAQEAGADFVGSDELAERVEAGWTDFDVAIATPDQMPKVGRLGRVLGPQGLMPNPKVGTVTNDVTKAVEESKSGKIEYRTDRQAVIHLSIGKASFDRQALLENYAAVIDEIVKAKPAAAKGRYLITVTLTTTMGPGIKVDTGRQTAGEVLAAAGLIEDPEELAEATSNGGGAAEAEAPAAKSEPSAQADAIASLEERAAEAEAAEDGDDAPEAEAEEEPVEDHPEAGDTPAGAEVEEQAAEGDDSEE